MLARLEVAGFRPGLVDLRPPGGGFAIWTRQ